MTTPFPFVAGAILTAAQLNAITELPVTTKVASYVLVAADAGYNVVMNLGTATTITVNTSLFVAGQIVRIHNIGAGVCTITAGTATVTTTGSLALASSGGGLLYFVSASAAIFYPAGGSASKVVQRVNTQTSALATGTTTIPLDDTIPQITEGDEYMTRTITPASALNILRIDVTLFVSSSVEGSIAVPLFVGATANALAVGGSQHTASFIAQVSFTHFITAGVITELTFRVRAGSNAAGTTTVNGRAGASVYGAITKSSITITEYTP